MGYSFFKIWAIIILLVIFSAGGIFAWQYFGAQKTIDWQTYKNAKYGVEFQYPNSWVLDDKEALSVDLPDQTRNFIQINVSNGTIGREDESISPCQPGVASVVYQVGKLRDSQQTFEEFVNFQIENPERGTPPAVKPILTPTMVGNRNALKTEGTIDNCATEFYYVEQNFDRYTTISFIVDKDDDKLIFNQILSTFRFVEPTEKEGPYIKVLSPNGGEQWVEGNTYDIVWKSSGIERVAISIASGGKDFGLIVFAINAKSGKYPWQIPDEYITNSYWEVSKADLMRIKICDNDNPNLVCDENDSYFSIIQK